MASDCKFENASSEPSISQSVNFDLLSLWMPPKTCGVKIHSNLNFDQNEIYFKEILILFFSGLFFHIVSALVIYY